MPKIFLEGTCWKRGGELFRGIAVFIQKINWNLKNLTTKKVYKQKCFSVLTKNLDSGILTKNLVTFKIGSGSGWKSFNTVFKIFSIPSAVVENVKLKLVLTICSIVPNTWKNNWPSWILLKYWNVHITKK